MRILAVDTSSRTCSVAVLVGGDLADFSFTSSQTHSHHLMGLVDHALALAAVRPQDLDAVAVTRGPGTFTGLRIGISAAKGIALAAGKPLLGISGLEALAVQAAETDRLVCPMVDARRGEVYCACYRTAGGVLRRVWEEKARAPKRVLQEISEPCRFVGDGAELYRDTIAAALGEAGSVGGRAQNIIRASTIAAMAAERIRTDASADPGSISPLYLRKSDAELRLGKRIEVSVDNQG